MSSIHGLLSDVLNVKQHCPMEKQTSMSLFNVEPPLFSIYTSLVILVIQLLSLTSWRNSIIILEVTKISFRNKNPTRYQIYLKYVRTVYNRDSKPFSMTC